MNTALVWLSPCHIVVELNAECDGDFGQNKIINQLENLKKTSVKMLKKNDI